MSDLGIFCTVARTELLEKVPNTPDETLYYLNYAIKQAFKLGLSRGAEIADAHCASINCVNSIRKHQERV